jgi:hypothetical protein
VPAADGRDTGRAWARQGGAGKRVRKLEQHIAHHSAGTDSLCTRMFPHQPHGGQSSPHERAVRATRQICQSQVAGGVGLVTTSARATDYLCGRQVGPADDDGA